MNVERGALGVLTIACLGLGFWNFQLHQQLSETQASAAAQAEHLQATAAHGSNDHGEALHGHPAPGDAASASGRHRGGQGEAIIVGEAPANGTQKAEERPERDWAAMRADIESRTVETVETIAQSRNWDAQTTDEVLNILLESGDAMGAIWTEVHNDELSHYEARKEMHNMRNETEEVLVELIGEESYEELDEQLFENRRAAFGGGRH